MAILVTRPDERGTQLVETLNKSGFAAIHFPLFNIEAGHELNQLPQQMAQLKDGDLVFAVSRSAVKFATETMKNVGFPWRNALQYLAVGQSSASYFCTEIGQAVRYPFVQENSEGVLALPEMQQLDGKTLLILRGNGGRELLPKEAVTRGANVQIVECYQRVPIEYDRTIQTDLLKRSNVNTLIVTSSEILNALLEFVGETERNWLIGCQLMTCGRRIANLAIKCGWKSEQILISPRADNASLVETLVNTKCSMSTTK